MKPTKRAYLILTAMLSVSLVMAVTTNSAAPPVSTPSKEVEMPRTLIVAGGASPGSMTYLRASWIAKQIRDAFPKISVRHVPSGGSGAIAKVTSGEDVIASAPASSARMGWLGLAPNFTKPNKNIRQFFQLNMPAQSLLAGVLRDSHIQTIAELRDKRIGVGLATSETHLWVEHVLKKCYGFGYEDIKRGGGLVHLGDWTDQTSMLAEGKLDCVIFLGPARFSAFVSLHMTRGMRFLPWSEEALHEFTSPDVPLMFGLVPATMPANTYEGQARDYYSIQTAGIVCVNEKMRDDVAYNLLEAIFKNGGRSIGDLVAEWKGWVPLQEAADVTWISWHPGAEKFMRDQHFMIKPARLK